MSHITQAQQGLAAVEAKSWDEAITKLSAALKVSQNPLWLTARSKAFVSKGRFQDALDDANLAWHTAYERNKRPLLVEAQYRRAVAYFRLKQFANADACCVYSMRLIKGHSAVEREDPAKARTDERGFYTATLKEAQDEAATDIINKGSAGAIIQDAKAPDQAKEWRSASTLRMQILFAMNNLPADDPGRKLTASLKPERKELVDIDHDKTEASKPSSAPSQPATKPVVPRDTPVRTQEFQSVSTMMVSILSKGVNKEKLQVEYHPFSVQLNSVVYPSGDERPFELNLWGEIDPSACKHTVTPNKVELSLKKKIPGMWKQFRGEKKEAEAGESEKVSILKDAWDKAAREAPVVSGVPAGANDDTKSEGIAKTEPSKAAAYPTSSRSGPKNWDKLADEESDDEGADVNQFFKKIFKGADPEQQRAMMKSFTESNGTSLSTNWEDVKDKTVETVPPEGVVPKKWN